MIRDAGPAAGTDTLIPPTAGPGTSRPRLRLAGAAHRLRPAISPVLALLAAVLWLVELRPILPGEIGSVGLITLFSPLLLAAYPLLIAAVLLELIHAKPRQWLIAASTALGVLMVYGLQPAIEQAARLDTGWLHIGFARYIAEHGQVLLGYDARFSWPGFFAVLGMISDASHQPDLTVLLRWAPVVLAGLCTLGMRALAVAVLGPGRRAWIATWIFLLTEWTEQDYLSPQGTTYVMLLGALALTVRFLVRPGLISPQRGSLRSRLVPVGRPRDRYVAQAAVLVIALALAPTHQLTPFILAAFLLTMAFTGRMWSPWLGWAVLITAIMWFCLGARDFWLGQLNMVVGDFGQVGSAVGQGIGERFVGDAGRTFILDVRIGLTLAVAALACVGWVVLRRSGMRSWTLPLLAIVPFGLIIVQSYGGEVFLRCYLFSLPFSALLGAVAVCALLDRATAGRWLLTRRGRLPLAEVLANRAAALLLAVAVLTGLGIGTIAVRGGNDAFASFSQDDVAAVDYVYQRAQTGQTMNALTPAAPLSFNRIGNIDQGSLEGKCPDMTKEDQCVLDHMPDFVVVTPSEEKDGEIWNGLPPGWTNRVVQSLLTSKHYEIAWQHGGSTVLAVTEREIPINARPR